MQHLNSELSMEALFSKTASIIADPVRSKVLWVLLDGRAYTATELAIRTEVSPQSISMHLRKLLEAEMLSVVKQGRHRYYRFSRDEVAYAIESLANLMTPRLYHSVNAIDGVKYCRSCYDHLAGFGSIKITNGLLRNDVLVESGQSFDVTRNGERWFREIEIDIDQLRKQRRQFARKCLDWSERKHHLAGAVGAALFTRMLELKWIQKLEKSRQIIITNSGYQSLYKLLGISL